MLLFLLVCLFFLKKNIENFKDQFKSVRYYNIKYIFRKTNLEKNPYNIYIYGPLKYISLERYFPLKRTLSNGSINSIYNVLKKSHNISITQEDVILNIENLNYYKFTNILKKYNINIKKQLKLDNIRFISYFFKEKYTLIAKSSSKINSYKDIINYNIGVKGTGSLFCLYCIFNYFDWDLNLSKVKFYTDTYLIINDLKKNIIEGLFTVTFHPSPFVKLIIDYIGIKFIDMSSIDIVKLKYFLPKIEESNIPMQLYTNSYRNINTVSVKSIFITNKYEDINDIYYFTKFMFQNLGFFKNYLQGFENIFHYNYVLNDNVLKYHSGSKKFYKEINLISMNDNCKYKNNICEYQLDGITNSPAELMNSSDIN